MVNRKRMQLTLLSDELQCAHWLSGKAPEEENPSPFPVRRFPQQPCVTFGDMRQSCNLVNSSVPKQHASCLLVRKTSPHQSERWRDSVFTCPQAPRASPRSLKLKMWARAAAQKGWLLGSARPGSPWCRIQRVAVDIQGETRIWVQVYNSDLETRYFRFVWWQWWDMAHAAITGLRVPLCVCW